MKLLNVLAFVSLSSLAFAQNNKTSSERKLLTYDVNISPNPTEGPVTIDAPSGSVITLISNKGTYVGTWELTQDGLYIEGLPSGSYMARIRCGTEEKRKKFIVL